MKPSGYGVDRHHRYGEKRTRVLNVRMSERELADVDALVAHHKASAGTMSTFGRGIRTRSQLIVHLCSVEADRVAAEQTKGALRAAKKKRK